MLVLIEGGGNGQAVAVNVDRIAYMRDLGSGVTALHFGNDHMLEVSVPIRDMVDVCNDLK